MIYIILYVGLILLYQFVDLIRDAKYFLFECDAFQWNDAEFALGAFYRIR